MSSLLKRIIDKLVRILIPLYYRSDIKQMQFFGKNVNLRFGLRIDFPDRLYIGNNVDLNVFVWLSINKYIYQKDAPTKETDAFLKIDDDTYIGRFCSISCANNVYIGKKVMIADRCYIGDIQHNYENKELAIMDQYITSKGPISIGEGTWLGNNVSVLPDVTIGKHCVIGANSVVTKDVPDYHIAAGNPARVIRKIGE